MTVIANDVKPSNSRLTSSADGSPRRFAPRDDGVLRSILRKRLHKSLLVIANEVTPSKTPFRIKGPCPEQGAIQVIKAADVLDGLAA